MLARRRTPFVDARAADVHLLNERGPPARAGECARQRHAPLPGADHDHIVGLHLVSGEGND
jgi:hypothetical protein